MASTGSYIVNRLAPVKAWCRGDLDGATRDFKDMSEFERWYSPKLHGPAGVNSQYLFTDVLVDVLSDPAGYRSRPRVKIVMVKGK